MDEIHEGTLEENNYYPCGRLIREKIKGVRLPIVVDRNSPWEGFSTTIINAFQGKSRLKTDKN